jgi:hypothetical protein
MPTARRDASGWVGKRLYLAAIAERGDGQFLDQIGDGHRFGGAGSWLLDEFDASSAPVRVLPGNETVRD